MKVEALDPRRDPLCASSVVTEVCRAFRAAVVTRDSAHWSFSGILNLIEDTTLVTGGVTLSFGSKSPLN